MFFRKAKRIKELEVENKTLRTEIMLLKSREFLGHRETLNVETYQATNSYPYFFDKNAMEIDIKHKLFISLYPLMKVEIDYDPTKDKFVAKASIRVVKER